MSKGGLALSSLVMAIPAGLMAYLSIRSVFEMNEKMPTTVTIIVWALILLGVLIAISPIIFLIAGPKGAVAGPAPVADDVESLPVADPKKKPAKAEFNDDEEFAEDDGDVASDDDEQLFDTSNDEAAADDFEDNFNFDEDDEIEEEPAPKKKKKK